MQNRYVGDVGDFGKYGLLRALCGPQDAACELHRLRLGVIWYLVPNETHTADGKYIQYLARTERNLTCFRNCDPPLFDALREIVRKASRDVVSLRESRILPRDTIFYERPLCFVGSAGDGLLGSGERTARRDEWLDGAAAATEQCDVVFLDPDNGLESCIDRFSKFGPKYAYFDDLVPLVRRGQSLVIYHHISRRGTAVHQIQARSDQLMEHLSLGHAPVALWYHRGSARAFFILPAESHRDLLVARVNHFLRGPWSRHFERVSPQL